jgi:hypothetical protein
MPATPIAGALDAEAERRAGAETDVDAAGGHRLLQLGVAAKTDGDHLEPLLLERLRLDADLGRAERERVRHRLADAHLVERARGTGGRRDRKRDQAAAKQAADAHYFLSASGTGGRPA